MADLNRVTLIGRLTRDSELKYANTATGEIAVCRFAIAVNKFRKSGEQRTEEANFFDIVLWGRAAESLSKYLVKGKQVAIDGELRQDRWTQEDGQQRSRVEIVAQNVQLLGGNMEASSAGGYAGGQRQQYAAQPVVRQQVPQAQYGDNSVAFPGGDGDFPDDVPF